MGHRELHELRHVVEVGLAHRLQLQLRDVELVLDAVLDPHRHQRVESQLDERDLPRQVLGVVTHRFADDDREPIGHGLSGIRRPLVADVVDDLVLDHDLVVGEHRRAGAVGEIHGAVGETRGAVGGNGGALGGITGDGGLEEQPEVLVLLDMDRHRRAAGVGGQRGGDRAGRREGAV